MFYLCVAQLVNDLMSPLCETDKMYFLIHAHISMFFTGLKYTCSDKQALKSVLDCHCD